MVITVSHNLPNDQKPANYYCCISSRDFTAVFAR